MSLADFAERLGRLASGAHRAPGSEAASIVARTTLEAALAAHSRTGNAQATTEVVATESGVTINGPRYLPFIKGALDFDRDAMREAYAAEVRKIAGGE